MMKSTSLSKLRIYAEHAIHHVKIFKVRGDDTEIHGGNIIS